MFAHLTEFDLRFSSIVIYYLATKLSGRGKYPLPICYRWKTHLSKRFFLNGQIDSSIILHHDSTQRTQFKNIYMTFESVLMRWMKLEPIIQSEVSQKEKHQYSTLTHIYMEFRKMAMMTLYARQQKRHRCV